MSRRIADVNAERKLHHAAVLLAGVEIERRVRAGEVRAKWYIHLPHGTVKTGYVSGPFARRHQAVDKAHKYLAKELAT